MRRFVRHLFTLCSALSLLLCVAVCVLWVRSHGLTDKVVWRRIDGERSIRSAEGRILLALYLRDRRGEPAEWYGLEYTRSRANPVGFELYTTLFMGGERGDTIARYERDSFAWSHRRNARRGTLIAHGAAPFWSIALATAVPPLAWTARRWRSRFRARRRKCRGLCPACAYDLRATPQEGGDLLDRCPECGLLANTLPSNAELSIMKRIPLIAAFVAGFAIATVLGLVIVLPVSNQSVRDDIEREARGPVQTALEQIRDNARNGQDARVTEQLIVLTNLHARYGSGGPPPEQWYRDVIATTQRAR
jgi:hypothetical protein